jgi:hypothetical protein
VYSAEVGFDIDQIGFRRCCFVDPSDANAMGRLMAAHAMSVANLGCRCMGGILALRLPNATRFLFLKTGSEHGLTLMVLTHAAQQI